MTHKDPIARLIAELIKEIDEHPDRQGLEETPDRVAKAWQFWTSGWDGDPVAILKTFEDGAENYDEMVFQGRIPVYSHCEHHLAPFFGVAHIGYIPDGKIVGLSKLSRVTDLYARRLQVQERLTNQICEAIWEVLDPIGCGVVLRCRHMCMESRGIQRAGTITYTSSLRGAFKDHGDARAEFLKFVERADSDYKI
jgi:GTP cyclohydrolase I